MGARTTCQPLNKIRENERRGQCTHPPYLTWEEGKLKKKLSNKSCTLGLVWLRSETFFFFFFLRQTRCGFLFKLCCTDWKERRKKGGTILCASFQTVPLFLPPQSIRAQEKQPTQREFNPIKLREKKDGKTLERSRNCQSASTGSDSPISIWISSPQTEG